MFNVLGELSLRYLPAQIQDMFGSRLLGPNRSPATPDGVEIVHIDNLLVQCSTSDDCIFNDIYSISPPDSPITSPIPSCSLTPIPSSSSDSKPAPPSELYAPSDYIKKRKRSKGCNGASRKAQNIARGHRNRKAQNTGDAQVKMYVDLKVQQAIPRKKFKFGDVEVMKTSMDTKDLPVARSGYVGFSQNLPPRQLSWLKDIVGKKTKYDLKIIQALEPGRTRVVTSNPSGSIVAVINYGPKDDPSWFENQTKATEYLDKMRPECSFDPHARRGGSLSALNYGLQHGNGGTRPSVASNQTACNLNVLEDLRKQPEFIRIAGMMNSLFLTWAPNLWFYYAHTMGLLFDSAVKAKYGDSIWLPFANCIFSQFAINFGPWAIALPHRDIKNLSFGWCAITALGKYDFKQGGHIVMWDLGLIFEFPPGATVMIPSSVVCHSNTRIRSFECRYSLTTFTSGGLFRWVEHNCQLEKVYAKVKVVAEIAADATRWARGLAYFSTMEELQRDV